MRTFASSSSLAARSYYRHSFLDAAGDKQKQQLLDSETWVSLGKLASVALLQGGQFAVLRADLAEIKTLMQLDDDQLRSSVKVDATRPAQCTERPQRLDSPRLRRAPPRCSRRGGRPWSTTSATLTWQSRSLCFPHSQRSAIEAFIASGAFPDPVTDEFIGAVNQVFQRFDVRRVDGSRLLARPVPRQRRSISRRAPRAVRGPPGSVDCRRST